MKKNKETVVDTTVPTIEEINAAGDVYFALVARYAAQFVKKTDGTKSLGDAGYTFATNAQKRKNQFPEVLTGTFDNADFDEKLEGVTDLNTIRQNCQGVIDNTKEALLICKTDAAAHANVVYGLFQDAKKNAKYKTAHDELAPFYTKSRAEKVDDDGTSKRGKKSPPDTTDTSTTKKEA